MIIYFVVPRAILLYERNIRSPTLVGLSLAHPTILVQYPTILQYPKNAAYILYVVGFSRRMDFEKIDFLPLLQPKNKKQNYRHAYCNVTTTTHNNQTIYEQNNTNQFTQRLIFDPITLAVPHPMTVLL